MRRKIKQNNFLQTHDKIINDVSKNKIANIPSCLLTHELTIALKLQEQSFVILIPQKLIQKLGCNEDEINFELGKHENKIHLVQSDGMFN